MAALRTIKVTAFLAAGGPHRAIARRLMWPLVVAGFIVVIFLLSQYRLPAIEALPLVTSCIDSCSLRGDRECPRVSALHFPDLDQGERKRWGGSQQVRTLQPCTFIRTVTGRRWYRHDSGCAWKPVAQVPACLIRSPSIPIRLRKLVI